MIIEKEELLVFGRELKPGVAIKIVEGKVGDKALGNQGPHNGIVIKNEKTRLTYRCLTGDYTVQALHYGGLYEIEILR